MTAVTIHHQRGHIGSDSWTTTSRSLLHMIRYPPLTAFVVVLPVVFLQLFGDVFGGTIAAGLPGGAAGLLTRVPSRSPGPRWRWEWRRSRWRPPATSRSS